jgi:hypothetical protein
MKNNRKSEVGQVRMTTNSDEMYVILEVSDNLIKVKLLDGIESGEIMVWRADYVDEDIVVM